MPKIGDVIGRFRLEQELGRGPMSDVYLGLESATGWKVAFKVFVLEPGSKPEDRGMWAQRMLREARAAARFEHENTVRVHEVGELEGAPYLVRDFIEGRSLAEFIPDRSHGALERKLRWLRELALTLSEIHRAGLVHRDVKPTNVLIRRDGALRILDFGVARRSVDRAAGVAGPERTRVLGTPAYMAPERLGHQGTSAAADQFGWGVLAYELLAGRLPWGARARLGKDAKRLRPVKIIAAICTEDPPSVRDFVPELSPALAKVLDRTMAKEPSVRFPSMEHVLRAFDDAVR